VPKIEILGDRDMYVKTGSTVAIRCVIKQSLEGPFYVFWYHEGDRVLNYQLGKIDIQTKRIEQDTVSSLVIHNARREDSGNYTCSPSNLDSASVQLHVLNGEWNILSGQKFVKKKIKIKTRATVFQLFSFPERKLLCYIFTVYEILFFTQTFKKKHLIINSCNNNMNFYKKIFDNYNYYSDSKCDMNTRLQSSLQHV